MHNGDSVRNIIKRALPPEFTYRRRNPEGKASLLKYQVEDIYVKEEKYNVICMNYLG